MKRKYTQIPAAQIFINNEEQKLTRRQILDAVLLLDLPLIHLKKIANAFGGYVEVKLKPKRKIGPPDA